MPSLWLVDAFTDVPFRGNPAGVCLLDSPVPDDWMQQVAAELKQAETAFLSPEPGVYRLRWFTPTTEVDLCGHATLASAHFLWSSGTLPSDTKAKFATRSGLLVASREPDGRIGLDFPTLPCRPVVPPLGLFSALGLSAGEVFLTENSQPDYLVAIDSPERVKALKPDLAWLSRLEEMRGIIVTAPGGEPDVDFTSRFFAPQFGIDEDPVTGSAHCALAPFWSKRLGKTEMVGHQVSARGGKVGVRLFGKRTELLGNAVTVLQGSIDAPIAVAAK